MENGGAQMSDAETPGAARGVGESVEVEDVGDLNQRQRLESIDETRQRALSLLGELTAAGSQGYGEADTATALHGVVKSHLVNIEQLMRNHGGEELTTEEIGEITLQPPNSFELQGSGDNVDLTDHRVRILDQDSLEPYQLTVRGVLSTEDSGPGYLALPSKLREEWTVDVEVKHYGSAVAHGSAETYIPRRISEQAFRMGEKFLHESGLDARLDEGRPFGSYE